MSAEDFDNGDVDSDAKSPPLFEGHRPDPDGEWAVRFAGGILAKLSQHQGTGYLTIGSFAYSERVLTLRLRIRQGEDAFEFGYVLDSDVVRKGFRPNDPSDLAGIVVEDILTDHWDPSRVSDGVCWKSVLSVDPSFSFRPSSPPHEARG